MILGFDTSAAHAGAALFDGQTVIAAAHEEMGRGQAERLLPLLEELLASAGQGWADLTRIGVGIGPGNFTGVRISVAAARGLALSLGIPAVGVALLDAVACDAEGPVLACLTAPRGQVYAAGHGTSAEIAPRLIAVDDIALDWGEPGLTCLGPAADLVGARLDCAAAPARYAPATAIARIAARRAIRPGERPAPLYLKPADAAPSSDQPPALLDD